MTSLPEPAEHRSSITAYPDLATTRMGAALLTGLLAGADRRRDRHLKSIYAAALGALAELHIERLRARLP